MLAAGWGISRQVKQERHVAWIQAVTTEERRGGTKRSLGETWAGSGKELDVGCQRRREVGGGYPGISPGEV